MALGPVEYAVIAFPGNRFNGDVVPALIDLVAVSYTHLDVYKRQAQHGGLTSEVFGRVFLA